MGSNTSKPTNEAPAVAVQKNELDVCDNSNPRNLTPEITRTLLQNKSSGKHSITKNVHLRKTFENANGEEKLIHNNHIFSSVIKNHLQSYDPYSPTQEFEQTPIIITKKFDKVPDAKQLLRLQYNNYCASPVLEPDNEDSYDSCADACENSPDLVVSRNLCEELITLDDTLNDYDSLGSSTDSNEAIENNISKEIEPKFLETNFEYVESDDKFEDSEDLIASIDDSDKIYEDEDDVPVFKVLDDDPRSPSIGIERTPIVVATIEDLSDGNVETMSDDTLSLQNRRHFNFKVLQNSNAEIRQTGSKTDKNVDGLLIYEDKTANLNDTPKKSKPASNSGSRTPLSCMKNKPDIGRTITKSTNTFYDPKNQKNVLCKIPKRVSNIPRHKFLSKQSNLISEGSSVSLKNISKRAAIGGNFQNTPPHLHH